MRAGAALALALAACGQDAGAPEPRPPERLSREQLLDPTTCQGCHPRHYREWASSMHAYAADDPVFVAMNQRGQRETKGELGALCVRCHAPVALLEQRTSDGLNLADLPKKLRGVTCYACHDATGIEQDHNGALTFAKDDVMRANLDEPVDPGVHGVARSAFHDRNSSDSSRMCGGCHDVVNGHGVHVEQTYLEYTESLLGKPGPAFDTCQGCHMDARRGVAAVLPDLELPERTLHEHLWPGVDLALSDAPDRELQQRAVACALANGTRVTSLEVTPLGEFTITLETNAGHAQPSGAAHDRRLWLEVVAYDEAGEVLFESGRGDGSVPSESDPQLWLMRAYLYDAQGKPVSMLWEAAPSQLYPEGHELDALPALRGAGVAHTRSRTYRLPSLPARLTARLRMRAIGTDVLDELVASGDLAAEVAARMPTLSLEGTAVEWTRADGFTPITTPSPSSLRCPDDYLCMLDPDAAQCSD